MKKGQRVVCTAPGYSGVWKVLKRQKKVSGVWLTVLQKRKTAVVAADDCRLFRTPKELSKKELQELVEGLLEMMYADDEETDAGAYRDVWNPERDVNGGDLVDWVSHEFEHRGLIPPNGPRSEAK